MFGRGLGRAEKERRRRGRQRGFVGLTVMTLVAAFGIAASTPALAVHDLGDFELDKDATNNVITSKLAVLNANINATVTSIVVCQVISANPTTPATILVDSERMTVSAVGNASGGGCTGAFKRTYTVARHAGGTAAAAHSGGEDVSLLATSSNTGDDWADVYASVNADANDTGDDDKCLALGAVECAFTADPQVPTDTSIFTTGGSKDDLDVPNWRWTTGSVPDADEILDGYAAKYVDSATDDQILYFGADRYATNGSKDFGFWFFRNPIVKNDNGTFTGEHVGTEADPGDILVLGTFTQGGAATNIRVFRWVGTGGNATANGTVQGPDATLGDCVPGSSGDEGCGTVNNSTIEVPWPYLAKGEDAVNGLKEIPSGGFVEGGINLTLLGLEGCFSSFVAETRSSPSVDAQLKDFILGNFEACGATMVTHPGDAAGDLMTDSGEGTALPDVSIGTGAVNVTDRADFAVTGTSTWDGTLKFFLCGPIDDPATCDTGGVPIGGTIAVDETTTVPYASDPATVTEVGRYCWRAVLDVDIANVPDAVDSSTSECFEVLPVPTSLTTQASAAVDIGNAISDVASLSGTATQPGTNGPNATYPSINATDGADADGTITFDLYGPDDATCATSITQLTASVSGNGDYSSGDYTPTAAGTYRWVASYDGSSPNTLGTSGACNDANESVVVNPLQPTITTNAVDGPVPLGDPISDSATLSGTADQPDGDPAGGTITFNAYGPDDTDCSGAAVFTSTAAVTGDGTYGSGDFTPTAAGTYRWIASYDGDSPNTLPVSGACNDEDEASVVISLTPSVSTSQFFYPNDSATVTVASGGGALAGTLRFQVWTNDTCSGEALYDSGALNITSGTGDNLTRTLETANTTNRVAATQSVPNPAVYWKVDYDSTNPAHEDVTGTCGTEHSLITITNS